MESIIAHLGTAKSHIQQGMSSLSMSGNQVTDPSRGPNSDLPHYDSGPTPSHPFQSGPNSDIPHYEAPDNAYENVVEFPIVGEVSPNIPVPLPGLLELPNGAQLSPGETVSLELRSGENGPFQSVTVSNGVSGLGGVGLENPILNQGGESEITMTFEVDAVAGVTASADGKVFGGGLDIYAGGSLSYSVTMPEGAYEAIRDGSMPPPILSDPTTWPVGSQVLLTTEMVQGTSMEASYRGFLMQNGIEESAGVVVGMTVADDGTLRAYAGDTGSVSQYLFAGIGNADFNIGIGNDTQLRDSNLVFRDVDINHPDADNPIDLISSMTLNTDSSDAVINAGQIDLVTYTSATSLDLNLGPVGGSFEIGENGGRSMTITHADGSQDVEFFASYAGGQSILMQTSIDPSGNATVEAGEYYDTLSPNSEVYSHLGIASGTQIIPPGSDATVQIKITPEFMNELSERYADAYTRDEFIRFAGENYIDIDTTTAQLSLGTPDEFLTQMGRGLDSSDNLASLMSGIVSHDQIYLGETVPFEHLEFEIISN